MQLMLIPRAVINKLQPIFYWYASAPQGWGIMHRWPLSVLLSSAWP